MDPAGCPFGDDGGLFKVGRTGRNESGEAASGGGGGGAGGDHLVASREVVQGCRKLQKPRSSTKNEDVEMLTTADRTDTAATALPVSYSRQPGVCDVACLRMCWKEKRRKG